MQELAELETRAGTLQIQYDDLTAAQQSLQEIIAKINTDSRRLFTETFATIRTHFQELFRKLFGGGMADVVLEDETDILESGIEIIARPPGKELRSISLMSGGEKTMTAVALLLAIFRSKPSPFCILDEVDAALDEANIGRFTGGAARVPGPLAVHHHHALEADDGVRRRAVRRHHAGVGHLAAGRGPLRGLAGRREAGCGLTAGRPLRGRHLSMTLSASFRPFHEPPGEVRTSTGSVNRKSELQPRCDALPFQPCRRASRAPNGAGLGGHLTPCLITLFRALRHRAKVHRNFFFRLSLSDDEGRTVRRPRPRRGSAGL